MEHISKVNRIERKKRKAENIRPIVNVAWILFFFNYSLKDIRFFRVYRRRVFALTWIVIRYLCLLWLQFRSVIKKQDSVIRKEKKSPRNTKIFFSNFLTERSEMNQGSKLQSKSIFLSFVKWVKRKE